jgi:hypothetical protein
MNYKDESTFLGNNGLQGGLVKKKFHGIRDLIPFG